MRGRNRSKGPNPLTRSYESNGPDVKIRGTAQHVADKYAQLARDATVSGDPVSAENYLQHAEHYYRLIAAAQEQFRQQYGTQQRPFDEEGEEGDEDGMAPNGYGYPSPDRGMNAGDEFGDGPGQAPYEPRQNGDRPQPQGRFDRNDRQDRGDGRQPDRGDNRPQQRFDRNGERFDRNGGGRGPERAPAERFDRNSQPGGQSNGYERQDRDRWNRPENGQGRGDQGRVDQPRGDQQRGGEFPRRDFNRNDRADRGDRFQGRSDTQRFSGASEEPSEVGGNLPAFLTNPVRTPIALGEEAGPATEFGAAADETGGAASTGVEPRARRTRRPRRTEGTESSEFGPAEDSEKPLE